MKTLLPLATFGALVFMIISCNSSTTLREKNKAAVVKANDELLSKKNTAFADEAFAADYPGGGPEMIKGYVTTLHNAFPDLTYKLDPIITDGEWVGWMRTHTGTHKEDFYTYKASGKSITWKEV